MASLVLVTLVLAMSPKCLARGSSGVGLSDVSMAVMKPEQGWAWRRPY